MYEMFRVELTKHYGSEPGKTKAFQNENRSLDTQGSMIEKQTERANMGYFLWRRKDISKRGAENGREQ